MFRTAVLLCLLAGCSRTNADPAKLEPLIRAESDPVPGRDTSREPPPQSDLDRHNLQCAALMAEYQQERNNLLEGDRTTLREGLTGIGRVYRERMSGIPNCSFSIL